MRKERKILRFVPQKLRKSFANGNPILRGEQMGGGGANETITSRNIYSHHIPE